MKTALPLAGALALALASPAALADSTSSASSASSTSIGSSSASIEKSSKSSSTRNTVAQGPYTVVEMVALADRPDMLRVHLQPRSPAADPAGEFFLLLSRQAAERGQLAVGQVVLAEHRPYGLALSTAATADKAAMPFFLVMDDAWFGELESRPLGV